ncbi:usher protein [Burkholderia savannae]|uniref:fimbria/pilus outer membrane usher protein n=1 Tax=Burkholderia savannae TaxID=1637837 RepID=UPI0007586C23|nr:fimbria/pilus outer membrane usher protein [Burkholderia savannae]AOJ84764.1 usher protein [Burkholderia savannae]
MMIAAGAVACGVGSLCIQANAAEFDGMRAGDHLRPDAASAASPDRAPLTNDRKALLVASHASASTAAAVTFNSRLLMGGGIDLSRFERGNPVVAGIYPVDLTVNGERRGRLDVEFRNVHGSDSAAPCFTRATLDRLGVDSDLVAKRLDAARVATDAEPGRQPAIEENACIGLRDALPDATYTFDGAELTLDLTIPQVDMRKTARGYVDPSRWDNGINAGLLQYNLSGYASENKFFGSNTSSLFLGLQAGVNIGAWRVRQRSNLMWGNRSAGMSWRSLETYVQRDLTALRSQITLGDSYTTGEIFESFGVRGVQLASDDRMLPVSLQSYAPTVRGVADTNARVAVRQRGSVIYEASVPPGPFEFDDLPPTGYGGDLDVTITESDGRTKHFTVPFASVSQLLRPGMQRFNVTVGQYRDALSNGKPWVAQLTYQRGMTNLLTGYAGLLSSTGYASGLIGVALNTPIGAFAFDVTSARTNLPGQGARSGFSSHVSYGKMVPSTGTNFSVAAYRYSTSNYYSLADAVMARYGYDAQERSWRSDYRARTRLQLNVNQRIGDRSSAYVSSSLLNYWNGRGRDLQFQAGFSSTFKRVSYTVYAQRSRSSDDRDVTQVGVNLSVPLGSNAYTKRNAFSSLMTSLSRASNGDSSVQANLSGSTAHAVPIDYGVNVSRSVSSDSNFASLGVYGTYRSPFGTYNGNASVDNRTRQASFGANGAVVLHRGGVTLSPPLGAAAALVEAKGARGGKLINGQGASIDRFGYAVIPSLMPYRANTVAIDPSELPDDVELANTSEEVVPRNNSIVFVKMETKRGRPVFAATETEDGKPLPMGSELFDLDGKSLGGVGQGGMAFLRGIEGAGNLVAKWGAGSSERCTMPYMVPAAQMETKKSRAIVRIRLRCEPRLHDETSQASSDDNGARND